MENHWAQITWIINYINMQEIHFVGDYCFFFFYYLFYFILFYFSTLYMMGETPEEWKNNIVLL